MKVKIGEKLIVVILIALAATSGFTDGQKHPAHAEDPYVEPGSPQVRERLEWFQDQKLCLMMHFGLYSTMGITESWPLVTKDAFWARSDMEWTRGMDDAEVKRQYYALNRSFNPLRFDPKGIAKLAKRCGFRYVTFTTKHHDGFCLYDTKYTDYKTTDPSCPYSTNPNADMVKVLFDACRAEGLGISCYFSKGDFHTRTTGKTAASGITPTAGRPTRTASSRRSGRGSRSSRRTRSSSLSGITLRLTSFGSTARGSFRGWARLTSG